MNKQGQPNTTKTFYQDRATEKLMYEDELDSILVEGLGFHKTVQPQTDRDFVDSDRRAPGLTVGRALGLSDDDLGFLNLGKKNKDKREANKEKRQERREDRKEDIRKVFDKVKEVATKIVDKAKDVRQDVNTKIKADAKKLFDTAKDLHDKAGKKIAKGATSAAYLIMKASYALPRASFLALVAINFRAFGTRIAYADKASQERIKKIWHKVGGDPDKIIEAAEKGKTNKPFICGVKCKAKIPKADKSAFDGTLMMEKFAFNNYTGAEEVAATAAAATPVITAITAALPTISAYAGAATAVVGAVGGVVKAAKPVVSDSAEIVKAVQSVKQQEAEDAKERAAMPPSEVKAADAAYAAAVRAASPEYQIANNPNLTAAEKAEAIRLVKETQGSGIMKKVFIGLGIVSALGLAAWGVFHFTKKTA